MLMDYALTSFVTLIVVVDPLGTVPAFLSVTHDIPQGRTPGAWGAAPHYRRPDPCGHRAGRQLATGPPRHRAACVPYLGRHPAVHHRLRDGSGRAPRPRGASGEQAIEEHVRNIAAFPLAIPLIAGPGAITATLLLAGRHNDPASLAALIAIIALVAGACALAFLFASRVASVLGVTGNAVLSRLLGVVLAALAVQFVIDGSRAAFG